MRRFPISPLEIVRSLWRNRYLVAALTKREVLRRYRGSILGLGWALFHPVLMLGVYTFVFRHAFRARWSAGAESGSEFALILFAGLIVFNLFAECVQQAPTMIVGKVNFVKKVVFPLEILPWVTLGAALFHTATSLGVWLLAYLLFLGPPHPTALEIPLVLLPLSWLILGVCWILASLGVYFRDLVHLVSFFLSVLLFMSPIFYPLTALPERFQTLLLLNPLAPAIEQMRNLLFWGKGLAPESLAGYYLFTGLFAWLGFACFQRTRKGFADVL